jgi:hypothetical protein
MIVFFSKKVGCDSNTLITYNVQLNACQKVGAHVICGLCIERNQGLCQVMWLHLLLDWFCIPDA